MKTRHILQVARTRIPSQMHATNRMHLFNRMVHAVYNLKIFQYDAANSFNLMRRREVETARVKRRRMAETGRCSQFLDKGTL